MIRTNSREIIIPFFVVGAPEHNLADLFEAVRKARK